jgi:hypothetical protein
VFHTPLLWLSIKNKLVSTPADAIAHVLVILGRYGKWVLPTGLLAALLLPNAALAIQSAIAPLLAVLLVISFLQINLQDTIGFVQSFRPLLLYALLMQLLLPLLLYFGLDSLRVPREWLVPTVLVAAASCIAGGPSLVIMLRGNGAQAIRLLLVSTLSLPITSFPVLALLQLHASLPMLLRTVGVLFAVVLGAYVVARLLRRYWLGPLNNMQKARLDGLSAFVLAFLVIGLMAAMHTAWDNPMLILKTLLIATVVNFGLQCVGVLLNRVLGMQLPTTLGVMTGNRAVAIFLTALPVNVYQPYLLFIACYQIPMYLTPLLGQFIYKNFANESSR